MFTTLLTAISPDILLPVGSAESVATTSQTWCRVIGIGSLASGAENTRWTRAESVEGSKLETGNRWSLEVVVAGHR